MCKRLLAANVKSTWAVNHSNFFLTETALNFSGQYSRTMIRSAKLTNPSAQFNTTYDWKSLFEGILP